MIHNVHNLDSLLALANEEIEFLKAELDDEQKTNLHEDQFDGSNTNHCIYGQLFGSSCHYDAMVFSPKQFHWANGMIHPDYIDFKNPGFITHYDGAERDTFIAMDTEWQETTYEITPVTALEVVLLYDPEDVLGKYIIRYIKGELSEFKLDSNSIPELDVDQYLPF